MLRRIPAAILLCLLSSSAMAQRGDTIDATRPQVLLDMARSFGTAELTKDSDNDPLIRGRMGGESYFILFYACTRGERCNQIEFRTVLAKSRDFDRDKITQWHRKYRYGKVYTDNSDDVILNYLVNLRGDGVSRGNLEGSFEWFKQMMTTFHRDMAGSSARRDDDRRDDDRRRDDDDRRRDDDARRTDDRRRDDDRSPSPPSRDTSSERERDAAPRPPRLPPGVGQN